jgi:hypothetical protein
VRESPHAMQASVWRRHPKTRVRRLPTRSDTAPQMRSVQAPVNANIDMGLTHVSKAMKISRNLSIITYHNSSSGLMPNSIDILGIVIVMIPPR